VAATQAAAHCWRGAALPPESRLARCLCTLVLGVPYGTCGGIRGLWWNLGPVAQLRLRRAHMRMRRGSDAGADMNLFHCKNLHPASCLVGSNNLYGPFSGYDAEVP
jgi:hypothetical protein